MLRVHHVQRSPGPALTPTRTWHHARSFLLQGDDIYSQRVQHHGTRHHFSRVYSSIFLILRLLRGDSTSKMSSSTLIHAASSPTAHAPSIRFEMLRGDLEIIASLDREWNDLCERGGYTQPFFRPYLASLYVEVFAPDSSVVVVTARVDERLVAVLPLVERSIGFGRLRLRWLHSTANTHFTRFDVVHADVEPEILAKGLWSFLVDSRTWDIMQIDSAPRGGIADRLRTLALHDGGNGEFHHPGASPYISLGDAPLTVEELVQARSRNTRSKLRRAIKRLHSLGVVEFSHVGSSSTHAEIRDAVDELFQFEHSSWKGEAGTSILSDEATRHFYERLVAEAMKRGELLMSRLQVSGQLVAIELGLVSGSSYLALKNAYNETFERCSPGHLMVLYNAVELSRKGFAELDLCGREEPHKLAWTDKVRKSGSVFLFHPGIRGRMAWHLLFGAPSRVGRRAASWPVLKTLRTRLS